MTGSRYALVTGLVVLGGMVGGLANPARADRGALEPGARDVSLDVTGEGVVRVGQEVLYRADEPESLVGFRKRLRELVGHAGQEEDAEEAALSLLAHPDVPFEVVQAILDAWRSVGRRNRLVPVELAGWPGSRSLPSGGGFYSSDGGLLPVVVSREPTGVGAATRSEPSYRLPDRSPTGAAALRSELTRIHGLYGLDQLLIVTRPGVLLSDVVSLIDILRKLGVEDVEIARRDGGLWERARARWDFLDRGEWLQSYEFLTPARRKLESLKAYVSGKQDH